MYDWPEVRDATDAWWRGLARAFRAEGIVGVPDALSRTASPPELWGRADLLLSQTCGYPLTHAWRGKLTLVAAPAYGAPGCSGADYCSFVLVRETSEFQQLEDLKGARAAYNGEDSQSGYSALRAEIAPLAVEGRFFSASLEAGAHANSMQAVIDGEADVCAIDAVLWEFTRRHRPQIATQLRGIATSPSAPGLPYVTAKGASADHVKRLRAGLRAAMADAVLADVRAALLIDGMVELGVADYERILQIEEDAFACGYRGLN
jgi:ABC-type phosphate/phosphonate transport system substrate-binding protein